MLTLQTDIWQKRAYFYGGWQTYVSATLSSQPALQVVSKNRPYGAGSRELPVAAIFERILTAAPNALLILQHAEVRDSDGQPVHVVRNLRGRPAEKFSADATSRPHKGEEFFFGSGVIKTPPTHREYTTGQFANDPTEDIPFELQLRSEFSGFADGAIEHKVVANSSPIVRPILEPFNLQRLPRLIPAEVQQIRFGMEHYRPSFLGGFSAFAGPGVHQRFFLEISRAGLQLTMEQEYGSSKGVLPTFEGNILPAVDRALDTLDLFVDLEKKLCDTLKNGR